MQHLFQKNYRYFSLSFFLTTFARNMLGLICCISLFWLLYHIYPMKLLSIIFLIIPFLSTANHISENEVDLTLNRLDVEIEKRDLYIFQRVAKIDSLRNKLYNTQNIDSLLDITMELGNIFTSFNNDSSLIYFSKGYELAKQNEFNSKAIEFKIKRSVNLPLSGLIEDGINEFDAINPESLPDYMLPFYYESGRQLLSYIASFYTGKRNEEIWSKREQNFLNSYMELNPVNDPYYNINLASVLMSENSSSQAQGLLEDYIETIPNNSNYYARACHQLSIIAESKGDTITQQYYLALSAMADITSATLEVTSLQQLGIMLFESGDINRSYDYLSTALLNAVECNAAVRMLETSSVLPIIQQAHKDQIDKSQSRIYLVIILLCVVLIILIIGLFYMRYQIKRTSILKDRLQSANKLKDIYISQFFRLSSIYVDKMNQLCRIVNRKISSGQVDELYKITKSNKFVEEQTQDFYQLFDNAFLNIYPDFIEKVNELLHDKIILKEGETLNNDLRILAFMRLGLEDTNQVAQILNYSVNTIYAYRNKLRNRAIDRDNFERNIMLIPSI